MEIIAEIANAHQGKYVNALELAKAAYDSKAGAVKFQIYFADEMLSESHPRYAHFKKQSFTKFQWKWIVTKLRNYKKMFQDPVQLDNWVFM